MSKVYPQELHAIWNAVLHDPAVPASSVIMEAMQRAHDAGHAQGGKYGWQPDHGGGIIMEANSHRQR